MISGLNQRLKRAQAGIIYTLSIGVNEDTKRLQVMTPRCLLEDTMRVRLIGTLAAVTIMTLGAANADNFPNRPLTLIVPFGAGGVTDVSMRSLATATEKHFGQPIQIENRLGAGATLGPTQMAATASPDGYTVAQIPLSVFRVPFLRTTSFDPTKDFTYLIGISGYTVGVAVRADAPWKTFQEFLADAAANPGKIVYGTSGAGTSPHITMEQIAKARGILWTHIPYKGGHEPLTALLGGHIHANADGSNWGPLVNEGKFRLLVTWGANRTKSWPNVPTLREVGIDMVVNSPFGLAGPKGMDPRIVKTLHDAFKKGMEEASFLATLAKFDQEPWYQSSEDYRIYAIGATAEQKRIVEEFGLKQN